MHKITDEVRVELIDRFGVSEHQMIVTFDDIDDIYKSGGNYNHGVVTVQDILYIFDMEDFKVKNLNDLGMFLQLYYSKNIQENLKEYYES